MTGHPGLNRSTTNGRHDFDFLEGRWTVFNRRLERPLDPEGSEWLEFMTEAENQQILAGLGNFETYRSDEFPGHPGWEAMALRLFDPTKAVWRIWWASTGSPGELDTPVVGRFDDGHGVFECDDVLAGHAVKVRYEWTSDAEPRWTQAFSFDGGQNWRKNWLMRWRRR